MESEEDNTPAICINCAKDVEISGNIWPAAATEQSQRVRAVMNIHIFGDDVGEVADDIALSAGADVFKLNLPTINTDGTVSMRGNWTVGFTSPGTTADFTLFNSTAANDTWICYNGTIWGQKGGLFLGNGCGFAAQKNANVAICFRAPTAGTYEIRVSEFAAPRGEGPADGYFAIVKGDTVVWPAGGDGNYANYANYKLITTKTTMPEMQNAIDGMTVTLEAGECLYFVAKQKDGKWSNFTALPMVIKVSD